MQWFTFKCSCRFSVQPYNRFVATLVLIVLRPTWVKVNVTKCIPCRQRGSWTWRTLSTYLSSARPKAKELLLPGYPVPEVSTSRSRSSSHIGRGLTVTRVLLTDLFFLFWDANEMQIGVPTAVETHLNKSIVIDRTQSKSRRMSYKSQMTVYNS